jgi:aryl-alcohol dehydrogenase-like predicted oxidoreductase
VRFQIEADWYQTAGDYLKSYKFNLHLINFIFTLFTFISELFDPVGVSNETPYGVMKFGQVAEKFGLPKMISIQNSYSLLVRSDYETGLTEVCAPSHENVGLLAYSPLCGGILTGTILLYALQAVPTFVL